MKSTCGLLAVLTALISFSTAEALAQGSPGPGIVYWPCDGNRQELHDSNGRKNDYAGELPGNAWNEQAAASVAAANYHKNIKCQSTCLPPEGCVKVIDWSYTSVTYVDGPNNMDWFDWSITNFKVWGNCSSC